MQESDRGNGDSRNVNRKLTRRKALAASSGLGGAILGIQPVVGQASSEDRDGEYTTEEDLLKALAKSEHVFTNPDVHQKVSKKQTDTPSSVDDLDRSNTPGRGHPDIYYGKYKNAEPPSGQYYEIAEEGAWRKRDFPIALGGTGSTDVEPLISDALLLDGEIGSTTIGDYDVTVALNAGLELSGTLDGKIGGELVADFTFTAAGQSVTISPGGFGFWIGPSGSDGWCVSPRVNLPGPLPGAEVDMCGDVKVYTRSGPEVRFGIEFTGLDICTDPCPYVACDVCGTVVSIGVEFRTPWISESDLPVDIPWN